MTVLVTGGAGYIGSHTVKALVERGRDVVVLDSLEFGRAGAVGDVPLVVGDVADADVVARVVADHAVDSVVHFAAYKAAGESMEQPERYFANNVASTASLLDSLRRAGVDRLVFSSSCSVYGTPSTLPVDEAHRLDPESPYAESKRMVEQMLRWYGTCHGFRSVSLRYFNAAGAAADTSIGEDWTISLNLVPLAMKVALGRIDELSIYGTDYPTRDGTAVRDYVHVDDLADAHVRALDYLSDGGDTTAVNLGTGVGSTVREVVDCLKEVSGIDFATRDVDRRPGDPYEVYGDLRRAKEVLGWEPTKDLRAVVASAWAWHSAHPDGPPSEDPIRPDVI